MTAECQLNHVFNCHLLIEQCPSSVAPPKQVDLKLVHAFLSLTQREIMLRVSKKRKFNKITITVHNPMVLELEARSELLQPGHWSAKSAKTISSKT